MQNAQIVIVDDDVTLAAMLVTLFARSAVSADTAASLADARARLASHRYEALVLDIMLPDGSGLDFCRELREQGEDVPILLLSARGDTVDRVVGLELGADDYLPKPFEAAELVARVRALVRRGSRSPSSQRLEFGPLKLDLLAHTAFAAGGALPLSGIEWKLLVALARHAGQTVSRRDLSVAIQPGRYLPADRTVDVQIARLRAKLRGHGDEHDWVRTVRGEGYVFVPPAKL
jgi:DNA-binding response OmpR family regulator